MAIPKSKNDTITDLTKRRKQRKKAPELNPPKLAPYKDVPAIVIRVRGRDECAMLVNIPQTKAGVDLVIHLIDTYPDAHALTDEEDYIRFKDIVRIDCPKRGEILIEEARKAESLPGSPRCIQVRESMRNAETGIFNIPDTPQGRVLLAEIFRNFSENDLYCYTLYTTDNGHIPVRELRDANPSRSVNR